MQIIPEANDTAPACAQWLITPSDTSNLPHGICRTIKCLEEGELKCRMEVGDTVTYTAAVGEEFRGRFVQVFATGTSGRYVAWY